MLNGKKLYVGVKTIKEETVAQNEEIDGVQLEPLGRKVGGDDDLSTFEISASYLGS